MFWKATERAGRSNDPKSKSGWTRPSREESDAARRLPLLRRRAVHLDLRYVSRFRKEESRRRRKIKDEDEDKEDFRRRKRERERLVRRASSSSQNAGESGELLGGGARLAQVLEAARHLEVPLVVAPRRLDVPDPHVPDIRKVSSPFVSSPLLSDRGGLAQRERERDSLSK